MREVGEVKSPASRLLPPITGTLRICFGVALVFVFGVWGRGAEELAARLVLLANGDDRDSVRVAQHYAAARGVPEENIIALPMSRAETISWTEFVATIWEPLQAELVKRKWIDAIAMNLTDEVGRTKYAMSGHRLSFLVVCRGVPLRVMHDPEHYVATPPYTNNAQFRTNAGAVDSELALLARPNYAVNAFVPNPLFSDDKPTAAERAQVIKVSRLDGPTLESAMGLVDSAMTAERTGLLGRAYVDIGGAHASGERWLEATARMLGELHFDTDVDRARSTIPAAARFDAPVLYFGWYAGRVGGPFALPGFRFPPGAVAVHIHSYSAQTLRSAGQNWVGPFVARGVTATVGNVFEPYLELTHRPDLLLRGLVRGMNFGDAVSYALPAWSWQAIAIGDPLYRPFGFGFEAQWEQRAELPATLRGYAVLRRMNELASGGAEAEAIALARAEQHAQPSIAVGMALAERLQAAGDLAAAADALGFLAYLGSYRVGDWGLAREAAKLLATCERPAQAVTVYRNLLQGKALPRALRSAWLPEAVALAVSARDSAQAESWREELAQLRGQEAVEKERAKEKTGGK
jgi:uncharacterized protein (TIGR03790 family)